MWIQALAIAAVLTVPCSHSSAAALYVSQTSMNPSPPYATPDTAANNIQDAVDVANDGDTVLVEPGKYDLTNQVTVTKAVTLQSTAGADQTLLNARGNIWCLSVSNSLAVVAGFTMRNNNLELINAGGIDSFGTTIQNCIFTNFSLAGPGPGTTLGTSVTMYGGVLSNSVVFYNRIPSGSDKNAVYCAGGGLVTDCQILGTIAGGGGTGIHLENSQLRDSVVTGAGQRGSGFNSAGPAVNAANSMIVDCIISNNLSVMLAGGAYLDSCLMDRCIVADSTYRNGNLSSGGGIFETNSIIRDSIIVGNTAAQGSPEARALGGGLYMQGGAVINCTVAGNRAFSCPDTPAYGAGVYVESGGITNSIIFDNFFFGCNADESDWFNAGPGIFDHCCTAPDPGGVGNLALNPQFENPTNGDFHVLPSSLCVAAGIAQDWMANAFDLDANPRTTYGFVDIGAYQRQFATPQDRANGLIGAVAFLVRQGVLSQGRGNGLIATASRSENSMNAGRVSTACNKLNGFFHQVSSLFQEGALSDAQARALTNQANSLRAALGCL